MANLYQRNRSEMHENIAIGLTILEDRDDRAATLLERSPENLRCRYSGIAFEDFGLRDSEALAWPLPSWPENVFEPRSAANGRLPPSLSPAGQKSTSAMLPTTC
jgi:hypothetical protein